MAEQRTAATMQMQKRKQHLVVSNWMLYLFYDYSETAAALQLLPLLTGRLIMQANTLQGVGSLLSPTNKGVFRCGGVWNSTKPKPEYAMLGTRQRLVKQSNF